MSAAAKKQIAGICLYSHSQLLIITSGSYQGNYWAASPFWVQKVIRWRKMHRRHVGICSEESPAPCRQRIAQGARIATGQNSGGLSLFEALGQSFHL